MSSIVQPVPDGFTTEYNPEIWNVGYVCEWSPVFKLWNPSARISIKPNECVADAYFRECGELLPKNTEIFFRNI